MKIDHWLYLLHFHHRCQVTRIEEEKDAEGYEFLSTSAQIHLRSHSRVAISIPMGRVFKSSATRLATFLFSNSIHPSLN